MTKTETSKGLNLFKSRIEDFKSRIEDFRLTIKEVVDCKLSKERIEFTYLSNSEVHFTIILIGEKIYIKFNDKDFLYPYCELKSKDFVHKMLLSQKSKSDFLFEFLEFLVESLKKFDDEKILIPQLERINLLSDIHTTITQLEGFGKHKMVRELLLKYTKYI